MQGCGDSNDGKDQMSQPKIEGPDEISLNKEWKVIGKENKNNMKDKCQSDNKNKSEGERDVKSIEDKEALYPIKKWLQRRRKS